ncbi:MAG: Ldh family oxidoreductase [Candidatus Tectimicrobiota bacterium]
MLDRFKVPEADQIHVEEGPLRQTVAAIFEKMHLTPEDAAIGADVLVTTDLRGVDSHGVSNMLRSYVQSYQKGDYNPRPNMRIVRESPSTATIDGDGGLGIILGPKAMRIAIEKAKNVGMGVVTMFNGRHLGAIGYHAMLAAQEDMVGMCMTATQPGVVPTFGAESRFGTNPIALAVPAKNQPPVLFDAATCSIANNKVQLARRMQSPLLPGWITDPEGNPIMTETPPPDRGAYHLLPLGATRELGSHKGYGLGLMVEVLCTMLSGTLPFGMEKETGYKHYFAAYNISAFTDVEEFKENMDEMLGWLLETKPAAGHERVLYPGILEHEEEKERREHGIPLHKEVIQWFGQITNELGLPGLKTSA